MNDASRDFILGFGGEPSGIEAIALQWSVPLDLVLAVVATESSGHSGALRYEKHFDYLYNVPDFAKRFGWTEETEITLQRISWGLMQIMLATARWRGFQSHPQELLKPAVGVTWGTYHLAQLFGKYGDWQRAISAYNQGSPATNILTGKFKNQAYVDKVNAHRGRFQ